MRLMGARPRSVVVLLLLVSLLGPHAAALAPHLPEAAPPCCRGRCCCEGGPAPTSTCLRSRCACGGESEREGVVVAGGPPAVLAPLAPRIEPPETTPDRFPLADERLTNLPPASPDHPPPADLR